MAKEIWFKGESDREKVRRDLAVARPTFDRLRKILEDYKVKSIVKDYDKAGWPYYRADADGYNRALEDVLRLIETGD